MSIRKVIPSVALIFTFCLMCAANAHTSGGLQTVAVDSSSIAAPQTQQAQGADCTDSKAVARAIYVRLKDNGFTQQQLNRINVSFNPENKVVMLRGFVTPPSRLRSQMFTRINRVGQLARVATTCEITVNNRLTPQKRPNCNPPRVPCGDTGLCLPPEECNAGAMP